LHVNKGQGHLEVMYDTDNEEIQRGQRPWLPPSRGAGRGRGLLAASQWSPDSTEVVGRTTQVDTVPMGYGRPGVTPGRFPWMKLWPTDRPWSSRAMRVAVAVGWLYV